jgi:predicted DNA-binding transcriptional regulator AlpA
MAKAFVPELQDPDELLGSTHVRRLCGGVTGMTLWRWMRPNSQMQFPPPDRTINGRRYWRRGTILAWQARTEQSMKDIIDARMTKARAERKSREARG